MNFFSPLTKRCQVVVLGSLCFADCRAKCEQFAWKDVCVAHVHGTRTAASGTLECILNSRKDAQEMYRTAVSVFLTFTETSGQDELNY